MKNRVAFWDECVNIGFSIWQTYSNYNSHLLHFIVSSMSQNTCPNYISSILHWCVSIIFTVLFLAPAMISAPIYSRLSRGLLKKWAFIQCKIFGIKIKVSDQNNGQYHSPPYLYLVLNQTSLSETFIIPYSLPTEFNIFMNIEYALLPFVGGIQWLLGGVVIIRQWSKQARRGIDRAVKKMRKGKNFYISIEGTRTHTVALNPYRKGPAVLAIQSQATIIPIIIHGARELLPYGEWRIRSGKVEVVLCKAISTQNLSYDNRDQLIADLRWIAEAELQK